MGLKMLWNWIKNRMLNYPKTRIYENGVYLTYEEIVVYAENFSKLLTEPCYGIYCKSELMTGIAILACFAAEKTAVPVSFKYGEIFCKQIFEFVEPEYIIDDFSGNLQIVEIIGQKYQNPDEAPALIMCTSGTSGTPKGVMLSEENILSNIKGIQNYFHLTPEDKILILRSLHHCAVLTGEFLISLINGTEIHFCENSYDIQNCVNTIESKEISVICGTPTYFNMLNKTIKRPLKLKKVAVSGECLTSEVASNIRKLFPIAEIYHVYGLTEASPRVAYLSPSCFDIAKGFLNHFLENIEYKIVDDFTNEVAAGECGELWIKGNNIMMGYFKNPQSSNEKMQNGWLKTGDIAFQNTEGFIKILGRKDDMIIYAGMNIYPSEIENALKKDSRVEDVIAYGIPHNDYGQVIGVKVKGNFSNTSEVLDITKQYLPTYARPHHIEIVKELKKNASGKTIRRRNS